MSEPSGPAGTPAMPAVGSPGTASRTGTGSPRRWWAVLRAEVRKTTSVKLWWMLLVPVVLLSLLTAPFGSLLTLVLPVGDGSPTPLMVGVAFVTSLVATVVAAVFGTLVASGEFRHRTATTSYLTGTRGQVLAAKIVVSMLVGGLYGLVTGVVGALLGGAALGGLPLPGPGALVLLLLVGIVVCALWGAVGVGIGMIVRNQVGSVVLAAGYLLFGENVLALVLRNGDDSANGPSVAARITSFLPGNAGDIALYDPAVTGVGDVRSVRQVVELLAGVAAPPAGWVGLLVLVAWTAAVVAIAVLVGGRRDVT